MRGALGGRRVKVGHAGTLDPFATGLLALLVGRATRLAPYLVGLDKRYRTVVQLGVRSDTGDPEGVLEPGDGPLPDAAALAAACDGFVGTISQVPPATSAIKVGGQRAYALARAGQEVEMVAREVVVHALDVVSYDAASGRAVLDIHCSKGTYVRALARDLGEALGCGAYCAELRRVAIGHLGVAARGVAGRRRGGSARRPVAHALQRRARASARARARARASAPRCCTAAPSRRAARKARCAASPTGGSCASPAPRGEELRPLVVVDEG